MHERDVGTKAEAEEAEAQNAGLPIAEKFPTANGNGKGGDVGGNAHKSVFQANDQEVATVQ